MIGPRISRGRRGHRALKRALAQVESGSSERQRELSRALAALDVATGELDEAFERRLRRRREAQRSGSRQSNRLIASANTHERRLREWHDHLVDLAVEALEKDSAADKAISLLSGGSIFLGVIGPELVLLPGAGSAAIFLLDLKQKLDRANVIRYGSAEAARLERAVLLIDATTHVTNQWLEVVATTAE